MNEREKIILDNAISACKRNEKVIKEALQNAIIQREKLELLLDEMAFGIPISDEYADDMARQIINSQYAIPAKLSADLYRNIQTQAYDYEKNWGDAAASADDFLLENIDEQHYEVSAFIQDNTIFIRCPLLARYENITVSSYSRRGKRQRIYLPQYGSSIRRAVQKAEQECPQFNADIPKKIVHFLFVYNEKSHMPDPDTHDIKASLDGTTIGLPCGDSPEACRVIMECIYSDTLPECTLITVYPDNNFLYDPEAIIIYWNSKKTG